MKQNRPFFAATNRIREEAPITDASFVVQLKVLEEIYNLSEDHSQPSVYSCED